MAREADSYGVSTALLTIAPGATNALLVKGIPGQGAWLVKYGTGGSLEIVGAPPLPDANGTGATAWAAASLVPLLGTGYLMDSGEPISGDGPTRFYLMATGATTTAYILRGLTSGF